MRLNKPALIDRKKATAFMDEKAEMQEDKEKALIATVHEIRNPLTAIKLTNQLMQEAFEKEAPKSWPRLQSDLTRLPEGCAVAPPESRRSRLW